MGAQDLSIYRKAVRTKDGRLPPEPVLGDSVMSGRLLISGRHLILTLPPAVPFFMASGIPSSFLAMLSSLRFPTDNPSGGLLWASSCYIYQSPNETRGRGLPRPLRADARAEGGRCGQMRGRHWVARVANGHGRHLGPAVASRHQRI